MKKQDNLVVQKEPKRTSKWVIALIVIFSVICTILPIIAVVFLLIFFDESVYTEFEENNYGEILVDDDARIYGVESYYDLDNDSYCIQGYFENLDDEEIDYVYIEYLLYDKNDVLLGSATAYVDNLKANGKWKFKATYYDIDSREVAKYELSSVEIY